MNNKLERSLLIPAWGLFVLALLCVLFFARTLFIPITLAVVAAFLLTPPVKQLRRWGLPRPIGALVIITLFTSAGVGAANYLADPVSVWLQRLPQETRQIEFKLRDLKHSLESVQQTTITLEDLASVDKSPNSREIVLKEKGLMDAMVDNTQVALVGIASFLGLLYFSLAYGNQLAHQAGRLMRGSGYQTLVISIARDAQVQVSRYLMLVTAINIVLGLTVTLAMWLLNVPNPAVWGASAAILNYIPYVGPFINILVVGMVSLITFDQLSQILLPPLVLLAINLLEGQIVQPTFVGRLFTINPVVVFLWILLWAWLWGIAGVFLAVPLMMIGKIVFEQTRKREAKLAAAMPQASATDEPAVQ